MNWNENKSVAFSRLCTALFAVLLAAVDVGAGWMYPVAAQLLAPGQCIALFLLFYLCSVPAWAALWGLWSLLGNLKRGRVFIPENVRQMRRVSWCCFIVSALCLTGTVTVGMPLAELVLAAAAAFMGLIVRIVKNAFEQAILMKDELDLTI